MEIDIVRSKPCIDTCHQLSDEKILAIAAKERLFALVRAQPHRSNLECYNEIRTSLSEENLGALFYMDSFSKYFTIIITKMEKRNSSPCTTIL